ncbi:hypothetical protein KJS94_10525 [Flavihumibacter rivuli]|uniref:hypothetical protein n=1 Tax=Flavihumibacter rivuli TaxID=2838156 RepID=UPI001BDF47E6|nr:hypothetical protein [Flavihumibacter rivuli]ULQ55074.1 hypothetical protein KJS94_10525 [Flavihumibacter rivuli]
MKALVFFYILLIVSCNSIDKMVNHPDGTTEKGKMDENRLFNGVVKVYDNLNRDIGYRTYKHGLLHGPSVIRISGSHRDSVNYSNGFKNGYMYRFDTSNRLVHKAYLYFDKPVGNTYGYDSMGLINHFCFYDFSGNIIYQRRYTDSGKYESGNLINLFSADRLVKDSVKTVVFLYMVYPPDEKVRYEVAILDSLNRINASTPLAGEFFSEEYLKPVSKPFRYAIVVRSFNAVKGKDDLIIQPIE